LSYFHAVSIRRTSRRNLLTFQPGDARFSSHFCRVFLLSRGLLISLTPLRVVRQLSDIPYTVDTKSLPRGRRILPCTNRFSPHYSTVLLLLRSSLISCHPHLGFHKHCFVYISHHSCPPNCCGFYMTTQSTDDSAALCTVLQPFCLVNIFSRIVADPSFITIKCNM
jgi:hypothetical protein